MVPAQHLGQQFPWQGQLIACDPVIAQKQPSSQPFLIRMDPVAKRGLRAVEQQEVLELQQLFLESASQLEFLLRVSDSKPRSCSRHLHQILVWAGGHSENTT